MPSRCRKEPSEEQQDDQRMEAAEIIGDAILPVAPDDILGEFSIEGDLERQYPPGTQMDLDILPYGACDYGEHDAAERDDGDHAAVERHMLEDEEDDRDKYRYLRQSRRDQCPAQLVHPPEDLQRELLDSCIHEACREDHAERYSSHEVWIRGVCRQ